MDEIQKYKEIVTKSKFLVEDRRFRYILSGSLPGVEIVNLQILPTRRRSTKRISGSK